jgi:hypothetical protein
LEALANALQGLQARDIGVVLEYYLLYSGYRIDVLLAGKKSDGANSVTALELKQWSDVNLADNSLNVVINGVEQCTLPNKPLTANISPRYTARSQNIQLRELHVLFVTTFRILTKLLTACNFAPS